MSTTELLTDPKSVLLEAGGPIFVRDGLQGASVHQIGKAAGMTASAINYHFGGKEAFYIEAVRAAYRACHERVPLPSWLEGTPAPERLRGFVRNFLMRVVLDHEPAWHAQLIMRELFQPTPACRVLVEEFVRPTFQILLSIITDLVPPETSVQQRQRIAFSVVSQCLHYRLTQPIIQVLTGKQHYSVEDVEALTEHIANFTLAALGHKGEKP